MRRLWARTWCRATAGLFAIAGLTVLAVCWRYRVWSYADYQAYQEVRRYPIGEDLWFARVAAGEDLAAFTAVHPPHRTRQIGRYTVLSYSAVWPTPPGSIQMEGMSVIARDGHLIHAVAAGCTWHRVFFAMSPDDEAAFDEAYRQRSVPRAKE